jgi:hypothetical protein
MARKRGAKRRATTYKRGAKRRVQRFEIAWYGDDFKRIVEEHGSDALWEAAKVIVADASRRAPRLSGLLAGSGYIGVKGRSTYKKRRYWRKEKFPKDAEAVIGFTAPHAHLMESGRRQSGIIKPGKKRKALLIEGQFRSRSRFKRMHSRPFLGPALEAGRESVPRAMAQVYGNWLDRYLGVRGNP